MAADLRNALFAALAAGRTARPGPVRTIPPVLPLGAAPVAAPPRPAAGTFAWGGGFLTPAQIVARSNARGAPTTLAQFLANHPGAAAAVGQRRVGAAPIRRPTQPLLRAIVPNERRAYSY